MIWYWMGLVLILHAFAWGWGLTLLILPRRWQPFWPAYCAPVGLALQSAVVWAAAHTARPGTDSYARASLVLPLALAVAAVGVLGPRSAWRLLARAKKWWALGLVMAASLTIQAYPFTRPPRVLTSIAMTSCDAADYAVGARVLKEFARGDRTGYLGVREPVQQLSVDNFYDFWLRINHFSPSALLALNASVFRQPPYALATLLGVMLLTIHLPGVYWLARSGFRFGQTASLAVTFLYGVSPGVLYATYQVALGQLMAAPAIALLTWAGLQAFRGSCRWRRMAGYSGLMLTGNWLLLGSYNFFLVFAYVPLVAYVGLRTLTRVRWGNAARWAAFAGANLLVCGILAPERVVSVARRFLLFNKTPFGWPIPGFYPSAWYGAFADERLHAATSWASVLPGYVALGAAAVALLWLGRRGARTGMLAAACMLPVFAGYWWLLREDRLRHDNSSYDAYKLFTVFYPGILISLCLWMRAAGRGGTAARVGASLLFMVLVVVNLGSDRAFNTFVRQAGLRVDAPISAIEQVETRPEVRSVNVRLPRYWDRLWSNYFLLRKPQFFLLPTYEGRPVGLPLGQWDLDERPPLVSSHYAGDTDPLESDTRYQLLNRWENRYLVIRFDTGWYAMESDGKESWRWSGGSPQVVMENPSAGLLNGRMTLALRTVAGRGLRVCTGDHCWWEGKIAAGYSTVRDIPVNVPPGTSTLKFETAEPPDHAPNDSRALTFAVRSLHVETSAP